MGEVGLGLPELPGQHMETLNGLLRLGGKLIVLGQPMLLHELESGGHLFEIINLGPALIGGAFAVTQPLLYIHNEIDTGGSRRSRNTHLG